MISASVISLKRLRLWALSGKAGNSIAGSPNSNGGTVHFGGLVSEVYHIREPQKIPLVMSPGRDAAPTRRRRQPQGPHIAQSRLWLRPARQRSGQAQGQAYRQRAKDHPDRAVQGPQGPQCHAVAGDARSAAPVVEGASVALRCRSPYSGTLVVSWQPARQADDYPPVEPPVSPSGRCGRDQEGGDAARVAPQLRHPPARAWHRYQNYPGADATTNLIRRRATRASQRA